MAYRKWFSGKPKRFSVVRKISSLPIAEPTKSEVLGLWTHGEVAPILEKLADYELQHMDMIKQ